MGIFNRSKKSDDQSQKEISAQIEHEVKAVKEEKVVPAEKNEKIETGVNKTADKSRMAKDIFGILIKPLITEKATVLEALNQYVFAVAKKANKIQIARAVESHYHVKPIQVNIINKIGKDVRYGKVHGKTKAWKKAIVTLPEDSAIKIHEGV